jgi:hypothetical protein
MRSIINLGDKVKVINAGRLYSAFEEAAKTMGLLKWKCYSNILSNTKIYLVLNDYIHSKEGKRLLGITDGETDYIIGEEGVEIVESGTELKFINITEEDITSKQKCSLEYFDINNLSI